MMTNTLSTVRSVTRGQVITGMAATAGVLLVPSAHAASASVLDDTSESEGRVESSVLPRPIPGGVLTPVGVFIHHFPGPTRGRRNRRSPTSRASSVAPTSPAQARGRWTESIGA